MEILIQPDARTAARLTAHIVARALGARPTLVLGLATGRTMIPVYAEWVRLHREKGLDFSQCTTFNLDEFIGLHPDHPGSFHAYMREHLFSKVNLDPRRIHLPDGMAPDLEAECAAYERAIREAGGIDIQLLGIGRDGHIGFNEPLSALLSRTRQKALTLQTLQDNVDPFGRLDAMPRRAITMGVGTILEARRCLVLVTGEDKAEILARAVEGPITAMVTASALQWHPRCTVVVDQEAATRLQGRSYYEWLYRHEPEWLPYHAEFPPADPVPSDAPNL